MENPSFLWRISNSLKASYFNFQLKRNLGIKVGGTLEDVYHANHSKFLDRFLPFTIPQGLIVEDGKGRQYETGHEQHNYTEDVLALNRISPEPSEARWIQPLITPDHLRRFRITGYDRIKMENVLRYI